MKCSSFCNTLLLFAVFTATFNSHAASLLVEAESFIHKGGWALDQQFMDEMGSPYLLAHGMGVPVEDAYTDIQFPEAGTYYIYIRTFNWTSPWHQGPGPGSFQLFVNGKRTTTKPLGTEGSLWTWQQAGKVRINNVNSQLALHDLTGFDGRCDAVYFTTDPSDVPPTDVTAMTKWRRQLLSQPEVPQTAGNFGRSIEMGG